MDAGSVIRWRTRLGKSAMAGLASGLRGNDMNLRSRKAALSIVLGVVAPTVGASDAMAWDGKTYVLSVRDMEIVQDINTDDAWSPAADLVVRIARTDPEVRGDIQRLEDENDRREARYQKVNYAYFHFLAASRKSPTSRVESLTDAQIRVRLRKYERKARTLSKEIKATKTQVASLRRHLRCRVFWRTSPDCGWLPSNQRLGEACGGRDRWSNWSLWGLHGV